MAPETTKGNLAILDLRMTGSETECEVDRLGFNTAEEYLDVSRNAVERPDGADAIGNGTVFVWRPPEYYRRRYHSKAKLIAGATLGEKFEQLAESAKLAIALLTPDDLGGPVSSNGAQSFLETF
jgi:hypothetical protein